LGAQLPASGGAAPLTLSCSEGRYCKWGYGGRSTDCYWHLRLPPFVPLISFLAHFLIQVLIWISGQDPSIWIWLWTNEFWICLCSNPLPGSVRRESARWSSGAASEQRQRRTKQQEEHIFSKKILICDGATPPVLEPVVMVCTITAGS